MPWSSIDCASHCLADQGRTTAFLAAISEVSAGAVVLDAGAGSGVLAVGAQKSGAARVIAVEKDAFLYDLLTWSVADQQLPIEVIHGDVSNVELPHVDVVVAEMLDVWLLEEDLMAALRSLASRHIVDGRTKLIPHGYTFNFEIGICDWSDQPMALKTPYYEWSFYQSSREWRTPRFRVLKDFPSFYSVDTLSTSLRGKLEFGIDLTITPRTASRLRAANAVRISGTAHLSEEVSLGRCGSMNAPFVFPIRSCSALEWRRGLRVSATMSGGLKSLGLNAGFKSLLPWE